MKELKEAIEKFRQAADGDSGDAEHDAAVELADLAEEIKPPFTGDELATILHGLRIIQEVRKGHQPNGCVDWEHASPVGRERKHFSCDHFKPDWTPLTDAEIDALCERINPLDAETHHCKGCGRVESVCSADPCPGVIADRARGWIPPTLDEWVALQVALTNEGFSANLCGGGAAATYMLIELADGRVCIYDEFENGHWSGEIYRNREDEQNEANTWGDFETDCENGERDMTKVAKAFTEALWQLWRAVMSLLWAIEPSLKPPSI